MITASDIHAGGLKIKQNRTAGFMYFPFFIN